MKIELRPHTGLDVRTRREVTLPQDRIFLDGQAVGFVGHKPGDPVCLTERFPEETQAAIAAHVAQIRGVPPRKVAMPPARIRAAEAVVETEEE
jgi:hypothetical protein